MAIPQQVRQRSKQVEDMMKAQAQPAEQPAADDQQDAEQNQEAEERAQEAAAEDQAAAEEQQDDGGEEFAIERPDDVAKQLAELREKLSESEQRYKTLQGMARYKEDENQRLQTLLAQMAEAERTQPEQQRAAPKADPGEAKDKEEFGEDFVDMVNRAIDRRLSKFEERLGRTEGLAKQSYETTTVTRQERFETKLTEKVPNWRDIDVTEDFKNWLNSSNTRLEIVRKGMANYDANAIAEIFELYTQLTGKGQVSSKEKPAPAGKSLESKVAPSKGRASKPSSAPDKKIWTRTEIAQVFNNRRGYDQKEFDRLQREIFAAQKEQRVDYTR